jgi:hypothetical protein
MEGIDLALQKAAAQARLAAQIKQSPQFNLNGLLALRTGNGRAFGRWHELAPPLIDYAEASISQLDRKGKERYNIGVSILLNSDFVKWNF